MDRLKLTLLVELWNVAGPLENSLAVPQNVQHGFIIWHSSSISKFISWTAITKYYKLGTLYTRMFSLQCRRLEGQDEGADRFVVWHGPTFWFRDSLCSCCALTWWEGKGVFLRPVIRALIPFMSLHDLIASQRPYLLITITSGGRIST